jgi:hypothetical protein
MCTDITFWNAVCAVESVWFRALLLINNLCLMSHRLFCQIILVPSCQLLGTLSDRNPASAGYLKVHCLLHFS